MKLSFGIELNGVFSLAANFFRLILTESYGNYLIIMGTIFTPVLLLILIIWSYRKELKLIPLSLLSTLTVIGGFSWIIKYGGLDILLYGYFFWLTLILCVVGFNFYKFLKQKHVKS